MEAAGYPASSARPGFPHPNSRARDHKSPHSTEWEGEACKGADTAGSSRPRPSPLSAPSLLQDVSGHWSLPSSSCLQAPGRDSIPTPAHTPRLPPQRERLKACAGDSTEAQWTASSPQERQRGRMAERGYTVKYVQLQRRFSLLQIWRNFLVDRQPSRKSLSDHFKHNTNADR